jgi:arylsulfatase A-like enzyme
MYQLFLKKYINKNCLNGETEMDARPNIIFVLTDQMRGDCLGVLKHPVVETPNLDELGRRGVVFTSAYSSCPSCIASRAGIFTGLAPSSHGRLGYRDQVPWRYENMLPQLLGDTGYQTHCVGKTHFYPQRAHLGFQSLDSYEGWQNFDGDYVNDYLEWLKEITNPGLEELDHGLSSNSWVARPSHLPEELHVNTWTAAMAIRFLRRRDKTRPFFLNVSFHRPHPPLDPPRVIYDLYRDREIPPVPVGDWAKIHDVPVDGVNAWHGHLQDHLIKRARRAYYAQINHIDLQIGRILRVLKQDIKPGPTYIIFTSDHGEMLGDHHLFRKTYAYEGSAKIPLIICPPDGKDGGFCSDPVVCEDIYPTLLEIAGTAIPSQTEGFSLVPYLNGQDVQPLRKYVHGEHAACYSKEEAMQFLTDGREKYIWFTSDGREQFFDLGKDPQETRNLISDSNWQSRIQFWRSLMVEELVGRKGDGLSDGKRLIPGKQLPTVREELLTEDE